MAAIIIFVGTEGLKMKGPLWVNSEESAVVVLQEGIITGPVRFEIIRQRDTVDDRVCTPQTKQKS